ncbi:integral membrane sensor signal transduction histidine kinase [Pseudogulbenkiania sp. NH8B]|uniref:ATP-binding protein n=1 Tax=Pseudogulbenkiania sp. (strain NH8B) TaxID=748280 RepID=UPI000227A711|nr:ATP-binding protein [Pseudogulbenkiania sp. NH8B]BAK78377.1 integral membrane sensor signal transduction histidine kinase [Pseudogulbenkiania sp. NH8B]
MNPTRVPRTLFSPDLLRAARRLSLVRRIMLLLSILAMLGCALTGVVMPWMPLLAGLCGLLLLNLALDYGLVRGGSPARILRLGLLADVLVLAALLWLTGGAANPLGSLFLPPVLFAALIAPGVFAWLLAALAMLLYGLLIFWHLPLPEFGEPAIAFNLHIIGMWLTFAVSACLITAYVSYLSRLLAEREAELDAARETQLRDEQLVAVGMQAAGAAHSLSTPLNTLTLLVDELNESHGATPGLAEDLPLMRRQLAVCRDALARLKLGAEPAPAAQPLFATLAERLDGWRSLRPDVRLDWQPPPGDDPLVLLEPVFWPAFFNLINNAAEAGGGEVTVSAQLQGEALQLDIVNRQGCLSAAQLRRAGLTPLDSDKPAGLGIGMLLSHATLARLSGSLELTNRAQGGVHARVTLPLQRAKEGI